MLKLKDFFGLRLDDETSDMQPLLDILNIAKSIDATKVVKSLAAKNGSKAAIVNVAKRQQALKMIRILLDDKMLEYDSLYYTKEVNTGSEHDRRYGSEERLLEFALIIASTKSKNILAEDSSIITVRQLREAAFLGTRFDKLWDILSEETRHIVDAYRKTNSK